MKRKGPPCAQAGFGTQAEYEDCLEQQREKRRGEGRTESDRLSEGFSQGEDDAEIDDD